MAYYDDIKEVILAAALIQPKPGTSLYTCMFAYTLWCLLTYKSLWGPVFNFKNRLKSLNLIG